MQQPTVISKYDVAIIGAGPAGCSCALALAKAGLKVALLDKESFPRDKVCGDAIPGRAVKTLKAIDPLFAEAFAQFAKKQVTKKTTLYYKGQQLTFSWVQPAYTCTRMEFDHFLFSLVKEHSKTDIFTNTQPGTITIKEDHVSIQIKNSDAIIEAKIVIGADGAHSTVAKQLTDKTLDRRHHVGSVRAYYTGIAALNPEITEIYFDKQFLPSYLWVFPLHDNTANVGFGMLSSEIARKKVNIKKTFYDFIEQSPELKIKFKDAAMTGNLEGFGLPLGSNIGTLSGTRFMLTGDAASLIDPISGDGIGNAMLSGKLAAEQVIRCFKQQDFSGVQMKQYDTTLLLALGKELKARYRAQRILSAMPVLLDVVFLAGRIPFLKKMLQKGL